MTDVEKSVEAIESYFENHEWCISDCYQGNESGAFRIDEMENMTENEIITIAFDLEMRGLVESQKSKS